MSEWNEALIHSLQRIAGLCKSYKIMHMKSTVWYRKRTTYANNTGLIGAALASVFKSAKSYPDFSFLPDWIPEIGGVLAGGALLILRMGNYEEAVHSHKTTAAELASLIENIQRQFTLPPDSRMPGLSYYEWVAKSYDNIIQSAHPIPPVIEKSFKKYAIKRRLPIPDEYLLDDVSEDSHAVFAGNQLFGDSITPVINPRGVPEMVGDIEMAVRTSDDSDSGTVETKISDDSHGTVSSAGSAGSAGRRAWGKLVRALGQYDETTMKHEMEQFGRICGSEPKPARFDRRITSP